MQLMEVVLHTTIPSMKKTCYKVKPSHHKTFNAASGVENEDKNLWLELGLGDLGTRWGYTLH